MKFCVSYLPTLSREYFAPQVAINFGKKKENLENGGVGDWRVLGKWEFVHRYFKGV